MERFQIPGGTCMETRTAHPYQLLKIWHAREFEPLVEIKLATSGLYLKWGRLQALFWEKDPTLGPHMKFSSYLQFYFPNINPINSW